MKCKDCPFFTSSGFGMIGGTCGKKEIFVNKEDNCRLQEGGE